MRIDVHIHHHKQANTGKELMEKLNEAGLEGGVVLSQSPVPAWEEKLYTPRERIDNIMAYVRDCPTLYPFYFIDPTDADAEKQVDMAVEAGIRGFKIICTHFYPNDPRAIPVYHRIAQSGKPCLFHSGILYDGINASGNFNRPCNFEVLLSVPGLRFALAHISWPWCDECIAVFGKFNDSLTRGGGEKRAEMFVDLTPGTPALYRQDAIQKLMGMEGAREHILWGVDNVTAGYGVDYAQRILKRDREIFQALGEKGDFLSEICGRNFERFLTGKDA